MSDVTLLTTTLDNLIIVVFVIGKDRHYLYKRYPQATCDEMISHVLNTIVPIIDEYELTNGDDITAPFQINEHCARDIWSELSKEGFSDTTFNDYEKPQRTYKIRHKKTGQFSRGGAHGWSKKGKVWSCISHLRSHLSQFSNNPQKYADCEVIVLKEEKRIDINDIDKYKQ